MLRCRRSGSGQSRGLRGCLADVLRLNAVQIEGLGIGDPFIVLSFGPLLLICIAMELEGNIIESNVEVADTKVAQLVELGDGSIEVLVRRVTYV